MKINSSSEHRQNNNLKVIIIKLDNLRKEIKDNNVS